MRKIMFNDRYGLTQAVINGRKTVTRRIEGGDEFQEMADNADEIFYNEETGRIDMQYEGIDIFSLKTRYKVGEVVAVVQSYEQIGVNPQHYISRPDIDGYQIVSKHKGWRNKMYVSADLMPHRVRITGVRCERLQEISDEECMREGIEYLGDGIYTFKNMSRAGYNNNPLLDSPRAAFASLIDKISGRGTWERNPWVAVYEFELVKKRDSRKISIK